MRNPTAVELAMMQAVRETSAATPGPSRAEAEDAFRRGYLQGFRSAVAALQRAYDRRVPEEEALSTLQEYLHQLREWGIGRRVDKPPMVQWK